MQLPTPLLRNNKNVHKNDFGHILILAGSKRMLGASALCALAAMRSGSGLVTVGVPQSLNAILQKKLSNVIMTWPLAETDEQSLSDKAFKTINENLPKYNAIALGPGISQNPSTARLARLIIEQAAIPVVVDADALNALVGHINILKKSPAVRILTPHLGEMARLTNFKKDATPDERKKFALEFAVANHCIVLLKGHHSVIASQDGKTKVNKSGNAGMATAGSGDVLTGMIASFIGQGLNAYDSTKWGAYIHGIAGDLAAKSKTRTCLVATDIIDFIPKAFKTLS